jgi:ribosomal protein L37AE/L43A
MNHADMVERSRQGKVPPPKCKRCGFNLVKCWKYRGPDGLFLCRECGERYLAGAGFEARFSFTKIDPRGWETRFLL